ncbi:LuxR C-terminal-related transcriptional regulator [Streptomyces sp. TRM76323]|uniref:LuxR C-terminal-related transcriptional regulator n=1 Tax=Streptomyces tamarix TaxID=3078565 RepID=A0ABU3QLT6_9ACTN|nr:LuxR C-terminal-related transcriptional regulator [Streptomyces tamarix]MDT9683729.1 LuxR C-terminal-related transcriptional regulator [Streptomyces tamarix]
MLEVLGIDERTESVYRLMLRQHDLGVAEIAAKLTCSEGEVRESLDHLAQLRLLRTSLQEQGRVRAVSPEVGLRLLVRERESALLREQQRLAEGQAAVMRMVEEYADGAHRERHDVEYLVGIDAIQGRLEELAHRCESECLSFMPGGAQSAASLEASKPLDQDLMDRGVRLLTLYLDSVRNDQATLNYAQWLAERGGEVRTSPTLPIRMVMFDREVVLLPVDPDNTKKGAALLRGPGIITALAALFEQIWEAASPFGTDRDQEPNDAGLTPQEAEILRLLFQGNTDEIVARKLGIGLRTVRRTMSDLMSRLEARSRFEAGARAAQRGWLS